MQIRVVTGHPWEAAADLLVVPVIGEVAFAGELDELDRRTGGELRALAAELQLDELVVNTWAHDPEVRRRSYALLAREFDLG